MLLLDEEVVIPIVEDVLDVLELLDDELDDSPKLLDDVVSPIVELDDSYAPPSTAHTRRLGRMMPVGFWYRSQTSLSVRARL